MTITNKTVYSRDALRRFYLKDLLIGLIFAAVILLVCVFAIALGAMLVLGSSASLTPTEDLAIGLFDVVAGVIVAFICVRFLTRPFRNSRKIAEQKATGVYTFNQNDIDILSIYEASAETTKRQDRITYNEILKITESATAYYIYIDRKNAYIIDKNGFTEGTREDFLALLRAKINVERLKLQ